MIHKIHCLLFFTFSTVIFLLSILTPFELKVYDLLTRYISPAEKYNNIHLLYIDQSTIDALSRCGITCVLSKEERNSDEDYLQKIAYHGQIPIKLKYKSVIFPINEIKSASKGLGNVSIIPDEDWNL